MSLQGSAVPVGGSGTWTLIVGCGTIMDPTAPGTTVYLCPGLNTLVWEVNDGISTTSDTVDVGVVDLPTIPNAGPDQIITGPPFSAQLMGNQPVFPSYCLWTVVAGGSIIADLNDPSTWVGDLSVGSNIFRWTCFTGPCVISDEVGINAFVWTGITGLDTGDPHAFAFDATSQSLILVKDGSVEGLTISDIQGRTMKLHPSGSSRSWSVWSYPAGIYLVRAMIDGRSRSLRLVVDH